MEFDDGRGVNEALSEVGKNGEGLVIRGHHIVLVDNFDNSTVYQRSIGEFLMMRSLPMVAADSEVPAKFIQNFHGSVSSLSSSTRNVLLLITTVLRLGQGATSKRSLADTAISWRKQVPHST